jgi:integrase
VYLTVDDVARLAAEPGQYRALVLTLAYTGIRRGEAVALRAKVTLGTYANLLDTDLDAVSEAR